MEEKEINITTNQEFLKNDIFEIVRVFFPNQKVDVDFEQNLSDNQITSTATITFEDNTQTQTRVDQMPEINSVLQQKKYMKRYAKLCLYKVCALLTKKDLPWGSLTGIRPTKIGYELIENGIDKTILREILMRDFFISAKKAKLVSDTINNQNCIIKNDHLVDIYITIPICPSRCSYCSFISSEYNAVEKIIPDYIQALIKEIRAMKKLIFDKALVVRTIYIGGGTPSVLSAQQLNQILDELSYPVNEFTVECGRADTITDEKLAVLKSHGVTRICINPQTFCKKTLKLIGRKVEPEQIFEKYVMALKYNFIVNMDFIAGLPGESLTTFKHTINTAMDLEPHNVTIHTLSYKHGSVLMQQGLQQSTESVVSQMVEYAYDKLSEHGYKPYYIYRQKNQAEALENVGYAKPDTVCMFNIDSMEETTSILACGANAISKRVFDHDGRIERCCNVKMIQDYIARIDEMIKRKEDLFDLKN